MYCYFCFIVFGNLIITAASAVIFTYCLPPVPTLAAFKRRHEQPLLRALASALRLRLLPHPRAAASTGAGSTGVGAGAMDGGGLGGGGAWGVEADPMLDPRVCGAVVE
jgi:drug/metabolite transporter (DMT)-like permease